MKSQPVITAHHVYLEAAKQCVFWAKVREHVYKLHRDRKLTTEETMGPVYVSGRLYQLLLEANGEFLELAKMLGEDLTVKPAKPAKRTRTRRTEGARTSRAPAAA